VLATLSVRFLLTRDCFPWPDPHPTWPALCQCAYGFPGTSFKPLTRTPTCWPPFQSASGVPDTSVSAPDPHPHVLASGVTVTRAFGGKAPVHRFGFFATQRLVWEPLTVVPVAPPRPLPSSWPGVGDSTAACDCVVQWAAGAHH